MKAPTSAVCAIVRLVNGIQHPAIRFQVTLRPDKVTSGYIRLGHTPEDELNGWFLLEDILVEHVLGNAVPTLDEVTGVPKIWRVTPSEKAA